MTTTAALAEYVCDLDWHRLPDAIRRITRQALFDGLCCMIAGAETDLANAYRLALAPPPHHDALIVGAAEYTTAAAAAFHNAVAANALDFDDIAASGAHPGATVIPAALAVAERLKHRGVDLLIALVAGYEAALRVTEAIQPSPAQQVRVHGIATSQVFGAAAAAGRLLGLGPVEMNHAFGFAATLAPVPHGGKFGWGETTLSWVKDNVAWPAEAGVRAAHLAAAGLPATPNVLDGDTGFWRMAASDQWHPERITAPGFQLETLGLKPYPCSRWLHPMLDALDILLLDRDITPQNIARLEVATTTPMARISANTAPRTLVDAQYSAPHAIAMRLLGTPVDRWWWFQTRHDPTVNALMDRVTLTATSAMDQYFLALDRSAHRVPARLTVTLRNGKRRDAAADQASGSPERRRLSDEVLCPRDPLLHVKYRTLVGNRLGANGALRLATAVEWLESGQVPALMETLFKLV